jgi:Leucine-rich repeat (LRR) protein
MVHRKSVINQINLRQQPLKGDYANAFSKALPRAKFVDSVVLNGTNLSDSAAIKIIKSMDLTKLKELDLSNNPGLTDKFYSVLCEIVMDNKCYLEKLELEGNKIGDKILTKLCLAFIVRNRLKFLNVSKCAISDKGAASLAQLIRDNL